MKILVVGATGTIGKAVVANLSPEHEIIKAGFTHGDFTVDISDKESLIALYEQVGKVDAVIAATGSVKFMPLDEFNEASYAFGLHHKLLGQINLVTLGLPYINDGGSVTLISGTINRKPIKGGSSAAMVDGAIDGFVKAASLEMPRGIRINAVSPTVLTESLHKYGDAFAGSASVSAAEVAKVYAASVMGACSGEVFCVDGEMDL